MFYTYVTTLYSYCNIISNAYIRLTAALQDDPFVTGTSGVFMKV